MSLSRHHNSDACQPSAATDVTTPQCAVEAVLKINTAAETVIVFLGQDILCVSLCVSKKRCYRPVKPESHVKMKGHRKKNTQQRFGPLTNQSVFVDAALVPVPKDSQNLVVHTLWGQLVCWPVSRYERPLKDGRKFENLMHTKASTGMSWRNSFVSMCWHLSFLFMPQRSSSELSSYLQKIKKIDEHVGISYSGLMSDARLLG